MLASNSGTGAHPGPDPIGIHAVEHLSQTEISQQYNQKRTGKDKLKFNRNSVTGSWDHRNTGTFVFMSLQKKLNTPLGQAFTPETTSVPKSSIFSCSFEFHLLYEAVSDTCSQKTVILSPPVIVVALGQPLLWHLTLHSQHWATSPAIVNLWCSLCAQAPGPRAVSAALWNTCTTAKPHLGPPPFSHHSLSSGGPSLQRSNMELRKNCHLLLPFNSYPCKGPWNDVLCSK